jgi:hypothetical protein
VDLDVALSVLAHTVCAALRRRLPGYQAATPDTLPGRVCPTDPRRELPDDVRPPTPQRHNRPEAAGAAVEDLTGRRIQGWGDDEDGAGDPYWSAHLHQARPRDQPIGPAPQPPQCRGLRSTVQTTSDFDMEYASAMTTSSRNPSLDLTARTLFWDG